MYRFLTVASTLLLAAGAPAQQFMPHVGYVYPAGGRQGASFEVTVGGQFLDGVNNAYVSGSGVQMLVVEHVKPLTAAQFNKLRDDLKELTDKRAAATTQGKSGWTGEDEKKIAELRMKLAAFVRRPANPSIAETVRIQVTMAPDASPGERELRLATPTGFTNPLTFCVGQLPEFSKAPAKVIDELANNRAARVGNQGRPDAAEGPAAISLPAVINGQIVPGGVDRYRFKAAKGLRLVVAAAARELIPYISDAVPGWFQATMALYDGKGREVAYGDHYRFHPDPVLSYEIPEDGEYTLEIRDSIYRGREDFVYRIEIGEIPFVTSIFPLGAKAGSQTPLEVKGWNLPSARITQDARHQSAGVYPVTVRAGDHTSNAVPFAVDTLPERMEQEPNDRIKGARSLKLPVIINGRIDRPGDQDVFRFDGKAGEEIVAEVFARRLDSPLDSTLKLTDPAGRQLAANDDFEDKGAGLETHHADSRIQFKLPKNGAYYLHLGDTQRKGGEEYAYRLRIGRPQPDFELRVVPASLNILPGWTIPITVHALRRDGFSGDIALKLKDAPPGFTLSGAWIPAGHDKVRITLTVPASRIEKPRPLVLEGRASVGGKELRRIAVPAEDMMQAFFYHHLVPAHEWLVRVTGNGRNRPPVRIDNDKPVRLPAGGTVPLRVFLPVARIPGELKLALNEPPDGIAIQEISTVRDGVTITLRADAAKAKPGLKGNLILDAFLERTPPGDDKARANVRRFPLGALPAVPFEVTAQ